MGMLTNKVAMVTGAGQGIGEAIAHKLAAEGAAIIVAEINAETGARTAKTLQERGQRALFAPTDITQEAQVAAAVAAGVAAFGRLDILVNNAGKNFYYDATTMREADWDYAMNVDVKAVWLCCKHAIPHMVTGGGGAIINIASIHARMTTQNMFPYAAAKSALVGMTRSLALDWGHANIRVNAINPGWIRTVLVQEWLDKQDDPQKAEADVLRTHPLGRMGTPQDVANFVAFVASDQAGFITGAELAIDGGLSSRFAT